MSWQTILTLVGVPLIRNISGWIESSFSDGKIESYEWAKLGSTCVSVGVIGLGTFYGLAGMGIDVTVLGAGASAIVLDIILKAIKSKK